MLRLATKINNHDTTEPKNVLPVTVKNSIETNTSQKYRMFLHKLLYITSIFYVSHNASVIFCFSMKKFKENRPPARPRISTV
mmetsp:Transcript_6794/g.16335  ORF Transcript_6794/g.16335 Transcript_6794/m.16335 type:complete len:82 (+) Transcript_6794:1180-1425(+)